MISTTPAIIVRQARHYYRLGSYFKTRAHKTIENMDWACIIALVGPCIPFTAALRPISPQNIMNKLAMKLARVLCQV